MAKSYSFQTALTLICVLAISCSNKYSARAIPEDSIITVNGESYESGSVYVTKLKTIDIEISKEGYQDFKVSLARAPESGITSAIYELEPLTYPFSLKTLDGRSRIWIDGTEYAENETPAELCRGIHEISLTALDKEEYKFSLDLKGPYRAAVRHPADAPEGPIALTPLGVYDCGDAPKQVDITPDGKYIYIALLSERGFQIFDMGKKEIIAFIEPNEKSKYEGFVEGLFIPKYNAYFISQMSTGCIFEYDVSDYANPVFRRQIYGEGTWSKVIAYSEALDLLALSNWCSGDVSLIDYKSGEVVGKISGIDEPRGLAFSSDGKYLYVSAYHGGAVHKFNTSNWEEEAKLKINWAAMRHLRTSDDDSIVYVSDMSNSYIFELDADNLEILHKYKTDVLPNSIDLSPDKRYLFVSTRGPNHPDGYLNRSIYPGHVDIIDLQEKKMICQFTGGTQPTGLDVSPDGSFFVFSNFQDHNIEIYSISPPLAN